MITSSLTRFFSLLAFAILGTATLIRAADTTNAAVSPRERISFNDSWKFHLGDPSDLKPGELDYAKLRDFLLATGNDVAGTNTVKRPEGNPGGGLSYVQSSFDDSKWRSLSLPHDWAIEGPFDINAQGETGKLPYWGQGWYRKKFDIPSSDAGRRITLDIDGAMSCSTVWVNGVLAGGWPYGYSSYGIDITPYVKFGAKNTIAIRLDNPKDSSRWYPGAGIYRNVWLTKTSPVRIARWGTYVTTPEVSPEKASIEFKGILKNDSGKASEPTVSTSYYELDEKDHRVGDAVATVSATMKIDAGSQRKFTSKTVIPNPKLWDISDPRRYVAVTTVSEGGAVLDTYETPFGIRTIRFDAAQGFLLNGKRVPLNGVCNHHDLGALGAAFNTSAAARQLRIMKDLGVNALRTSHNMPAPELLDLCDKMGIVVMDESFDCWAQRKTSHDYHLYFNDWHERDLRAEYRRDRNHPSVVMWSLGNEIPEQGKAEAAPLFAELVGIAHDEDPTRPSTLGANHIQYFNPAFTRLFDLAGENYDPGMYAGFHKDWSAFPNIPFFASETSSTCSSRGVYLFPPSVGQGDFQVNSYDSYFPAWATLPDSVFEALDANPFVAGEFVWTGFDYLGEPTPYNSDMTNLLNFASDPKKQAEMEKELKALGKIKSPSRSSYFGIVDLCGFPKDRFYLYQARWRPDLHMVHILPHWTWPGREGKVTPVYVYTSGDEAELFLNGKSLGRKKKGGGNESIPNLALSGSANASSEETIKGNVASNAIDGKQGTLWVAKDASPGQWWSIDLGGVHKVRQITLRHEKQSDRYQCKLLASDNGTDWRPVAGLSAPTYTKRNVLYTCDDSIRYLKVEFTALTSGDWASLSEVGIYEKQWSPGDSPFRICWDDVVYAPGELKAVAYRNGKPWAEETVSTAAVPVAVKLESEQSSIGADGLDLAFVKARVVDAEGRTVPGASNKIRFSVTGGELAATDNGDATDLVVFSSPERKAFNGLALAIVKAKPGASGKITLTAESEGLKAGTAEITAK
jgi:beta-galactosidase